MTPIDIPSTTFDRREFLRIAAACSAALLLGERGFTEPQQRSTYYAPFEELPLGSIKPEGWLKTSLTKQAEGLGSQLPHVSWPFTEPYWHGETQGESWWPWEQVAYWIDGATRLALVLDDKSLMKQVRERIDYTFAHIDTNGYIGPAYFESPKDDFHRWPHALFFRGLSALADASGEASIPQEIQKHFLQDQAGYGKPTRNVVNIESILWCYRRTGDPKLLALAEKAWAEYLTVAADPEHGDLSVDRVQANTPINAHGVTYVETAKQPAILFAYTGKPEYLDFAIKAQKRIFDHHMLIDGIPSTSEWYRTTTSLDSHETCDISDHTWSWGHLMIATGDAAWGDRIERAVFNAGFGAVKKDWKAVQYFSCPNQFIATLNSDHNQMAYGGRMMAYQPNPGQHTACCGGNVHRFLPNFTSRMWMKTADGGLAATLYGPCRLNTMINGDPVGIEQKTNYPFDETIEFKLDLQRPKKFPLSLRIPAWCEEPRLSINGKAIAVPPLKNGFATLHQTFHSKDTIVLTLPMKTKTTGWPDHGVGIEHGPLVYSLPIQEKWESVVEPRYTTAEYPSWNATPAGDWNYAIAGPFAPHLGIGPESEDPWAHPPVRMRLLAKRVEDWTLTTDPHDPSRKLTPPLPEMGRAKIASETEIMTLVPYGSTHLRLTVFPVVPGTELKR